MLKVLITYEYDCTPDLSYCEFVLINSRNTTNIDLANCSQLGPIIPQQYKA